MLHQPRATAFAVFQLCQQSGAILGFVLPLYLPLDESDWPVLVQACVLVPGTLMFCAARVPRKGAGEAAAAAAGAGGAQGSELASAAL